MSTREHPHRAGRWDWITFLVTGPEHNLQGFIACPEHPEDRGQHNYDKAVESAKAHDVTLQDLVDTAGMRP